MPNSSDFNPLLGGANPQPPAEVRLIRKADATQDFDQIAFQKDVENRIKVLHLIADEYLSEIAATQVMEVGKPPTQKELQQGIDKAEQLLVQKLDEKTVSLFVPLAPDTSFEEFTEQKKKLAKAMAVQVYNNQRKAAEVLSRDDVKRIFCTSLGTITDDAFEIAKAMVPVLVPLSLSGVLTIPVQAWLYACMGVTIARIGVRNICREYVEKQKS